MRPNASCRCRLKSILPGLRHLTLSTLLLAPLPTAAGVYTWVDAQGVTHFGDRPPAGSAPRAVAVDTPVSGVDDSVRARQQRIDAYLEQQRTAREQREAADQKARAASEKRAALCTKLRARQTNMARISTFYRLNDQGERVFVSEDENRAVRERFDRQVAEVCDP
ncbi:DUF4124 domain-containing protein [Marinobacter sp. C2H3]|uniref:DUF4124 domain-containing protein n=1 Tax=Marinobacter sp. C2H3 TaxID=3119003 RepID=UPI00300E96F2